MSLHFQLGVINISVNLNLGRMIDYCLATSRFDSKSTRDDNHMGE